MARDLHEWVCVARDMMILFIYYNINPVKNQISFAGIVFRRVQGLQGELKFGEFPALL
jgi:hypothetical protein